MLQIPVLTYHSLNILGNDYHNNDHIALAQDLKLIADLGIEVISAYKLVQWLKQECTLDEKQKYVVLTFDDGSELDFKGWHHPQFGKQKSFYAIMQDFCGKIHATSFVIAAPSIRLELQKTCLAGHAIWRDDWWQQAQDSKILGIENHSWDHLHSTLKTVAQCDNLKGDFRKITCFDDANTQIKLASDYINSQIKNKKTSLFAYPFGHYNQYLTEEYFPKKQNAIQAAFTCDGSKVNQQSPIWKIPRFVCGQHWHSIHELNKLLN